MTTRDRRANQLLHMLSVDGQLKVADVCRQFDISESTARRMFADLERNGAVLRLHGGICLAPAPKYDYSFNDSLLQNEQAKAAIGSAAAGLVESGDKLFLDSGTTVLKLAQALASRVKLGDLHSVVVVTNSLPNTVPLSAVCKVILVGGEVRDGRRDVCGSFAEKALASLHVDIAFLGADAVHPQHGLMTTDERTAKMNEIVIEHSRRVFVLADSSKFCESSFATYASIHGVGAILTDSGISADHAVLFSEIGADLRVVAIKKNSNPPGRSEP